MALLDLNNVSKVYTGGGAAVHALREVNLAVRAGELVCVAGPSGSGKSTLLNLMGILDVPTRGTVRVDGRETTGLSRTAAARMRRDHIGFVFQTFNLVQVLTAWENIEYNLLLRRIAHHELSARINEVLAAVGLGAKMHRRVTQLSGGEQQRVAIARAIAGNPKVVLADEPTANLDSATGLAIIELFKAMNRERGTTFVFSTHDPRLTGLADRTLFLVDGCLHPADRMATLGDAASGPQTEPSCVLPEAN